MGGNPWRDLQVGFQGRSEGVGFDDIVERALEGLCGSVESVDDVIEVADEVGGVSPFLGLFGSLGGVGDVQDHWEGIFPQHLRTNGSLEGVHCNKGDEKSRDEKDVLVY